MIQYKKILMTLALLLTAVTGAWADEKMVTINSSTMSSGAVTATGFGTLLDNLYVNFNTATITTSEGVITKLVIKKGTIYTDAFTEANVGVAPGTITYGSDEIIVTDINAESVTLSRKGGDNWSTSSVDVYYGTAEAPITVEPGSSANTWTFAMPGSDVVLTPIYAKAAAFATTGTEPEVKTLLPEAAEGVIADTDAPLIKEGTGIVAFAGTSTEVTQGTLMYAIGTSATEAPALTAFSATVPTAKDYDDATTVYVWYYIQGADAPEGVAATLDNTFNDSEPACLTVTVLSNKFDITFNAANANTIEAGKATVTVGGTAATVTEGKLQGVKMGSEVKMTAKEGYKFRKVEVKKSAAPRPLAEAVAADLGKIVGADGKIYATKAAAEAVATGNAVAMIAYVGTASDCAHGLAIALADESGKKDFGAAGTACSGKAAVTGGTWRLPSIKDWQYMFIGCGASGSYSNVPSEMSYSGLASKLTTAQGDALQPGYYWSSTEYFPGTDAWDVGFDGSSNASFGPDDESIDSPRVRACLAF